MPLEKAKRTMWISSLLLIASVSLAPYCFGQNEAQLHLKPVTAEELLGPLQRRTSRPSSMQFIPGTHKIVFAGAFATATPTVRILDLDSGAITDLGAGAEPQLSPDGKQIAFLVGVSAADLLWSNTQIWISGIDGSDRRQITHAAGGLGSIASMHFAWSHDGKAIAYSTNPIYRGVNLREEGGADSGSRKGPTVRVFGRNAPNPVLKPAVEFHVVSVSTGAERLVAKGEYRYCGSLEWMPGNRALIADVQYQNPSDYTFSSRIIALSIEDGHSTVLNAAVNDAFMHEPKLSPDGNTIAFIADRRKAVYPREKILAVFDLHSKNVQLLGTGKYDDWQPAWSNDGNQLIFASGARFQQQVFVVDVKTREITRFIPVRTDGENGDAIESTDGEFRAWLNVDSITQVIRLMAARKPFKDPPTAHVLFDPTAGYQVGAIKTVTWQSKDGVKIGGVLILPNGFDARKKYPMVVNLHGGIRDGLAPLGPFLFRSPLEWHYWGNRGYIVFNCDFRSSGSSGVNVFRDLDSGNMLLLDSDDVIAGVGAVLQAGFVDRRRILVVGHSYGSYLTNFLLTRTDLFKAAISYDGGDFFVDWDTPEGGLNTFIKGTPFDNFEEYRRNSPMLNVAHINTPTMFINATRGINSPALPWLFSALRKRGIETEYLVYDDEYHVMVQLANQADLLTRVTAWIDKHIGGN